MSEVNNPEIRKFCLPWKVQDADAFECDIIAPFGSDDYWNVAMVMDSMNNLPSHEIAAFIVRACNSHYGLLEALEGMVAWTNHRWPGADISKSSLATPLAKARAAIARAKGEAS